MSDKAITTNASATTTAQEIETLLSDAEAGWKHGLGAPKGKKYPCGGIGNPKMRDRILHYKMCSHPDCLKRLEEWNRITTQAKEPGAVRLVRK